MPSPATPTVTVLSETGLPDGLEEVAADAELRCTGASGLPAALAGADVLLVWDFLSTAVADAWPAADRLSWVHIASAGVDRLLFPSLVESDVVVTNSRGVFDRPMAEYVLGLVLAYAKDLPGTWARQQEQVWQHRETERLAGTRALVVGTGAIGREIGRVLRAVGVEVVGVGRRARGADPDLGTVHASPDLPGLLPDADWVVVAAPLTDDTRGMFDADAFARMRPSARFVNVGRGPIVVEDDLVAALETGEIAGAALDVFETEPLPPGHPLWTAPGALVSPHMSGDAAGWLDTLAALFVRNYRHWRADGTMLNVVDKRRGYVAGS